jgi:hypothetical protein
MEESKAHARNVGAVETRSARPLNPDLGRERLPPIARTERVDRSWPGDQSTITNSPVCRIPLQANDIAVSSSKWRAFFRRLGDPCLGARHLMTEYNIESGLFASGFFKAILTMFKLGTDVVAIITKTRLSITSGEKCTSIFYLYVIYT